MDYVKGLWKKLHAAQDAKNADAATAYRRAIEHAEKGKIKDAEWWEKQGDMASGITPTPAPTTREHATR
jgi:hypothetical protein